MNKSDKQIIIDNYIIILNEYFNRFLESEINNYENGNFSFDDQNSINYNKLSNCNLFIGVSILYRIFEFIFHKTKNLNVVHYYCNEAISYYLEYIKQVYRSNLFNNLNQSDTVLFVYKKIIFELFHNSEESIEFVEIGSKSILSTIIDNNKKEYCLSHITIPEFNDLFLFIKKNTDLLLSWKHTFCKKDSNIFDNKSSYCLRIEFCQYFLENYLKKQDNIFIVEYLELLYSRLEMDICIWKQLLKNLLLEFSKKNKKNGFKNIEDFLLNVNYEKDRIQEKIEANDTKVIVKWIYTGVFND